MARSGSNVQAGEGVLEFAPSRDSPVSEPSWRLRVSSATEQSNTSIVFDEELILKVFRRLEPGVNPELELLRFLTQRDFGNIARLAGWYAYVGRPLDATLGVLQEYVRGAQDGWELALGELESEPDRFLTRLRRLGSVTGAMHATLGDRRGRSELPPRTRATEALALLTATVDEEIGRIFVELPEDVEALDPIRGRGEEVRESLALLSHAGTFGKTIRTHGDLHLGQTLWADDRRLGDHRLRGRARAVAARAASQALAAPRRGGHAAVVRLRRLGRRSCAAAARRLGGARARSSSPATASRRPRCCRRAAAFERLLAVFELEKAVYELRYELNNRPEWIASRSRDPPIEGRRRSDRSSARPHSVVGAHEADDGGVVVRPAPEASPCVCRVAADLTDGSGGAAPEAMLPNPLGSAPRAHPTQFLPTLGEIDLHLVGEGRHEEHLRGARRARARARRRHAFGVWAPNARRCPVVGEFNGWDGRVNPMRSRGVDRHLGSSWSPRRRRERVQVRGRARGRRRCCSRPTPFAIAAEEPPGNASRVFRSRHEWADDGMGRARVGRRPLRRADLDLRGASRFLAPQRSTATGRSITSSSPTSSATT